MKQGRVSIRLEPHLQHALRAQSAALAIDQSEAVGSHGQSGQVDHRGISGFNGDAFGFAYEQRPNMARGVCIDNHETRSSASFALKDSVLLGPISRSVQPKHFRCFGELTPRSAHDEQRVLPERDQRGRHKTHQSYAFHKIASAP